MNPNITKIIDQYLANELSPEDKLTFEKRLNSNQELKEEVELQQSVMEASKRAGQRIQIKNAQKSYRLNKLLKWGAISLTSLLLLAIGSSFFFSGDKQNAKEDIAKDKKELVKPIKKENLLANDNVNRTFQASFGKDQFEAEIPIAFDVKTKEFLINPRRDTVLALDNNGTVLHIPAFAFVSKSKKTIDKAIKLSYQEYTNSAQIAFSGIPMTITDENGTQMFNSSGMFSIFGSCNGKDVEISPKKPLTIDYKLVRKNPNTQFFILNEDSTNWEFVSEIEKESCGDEDTENEVNVGSRNDNPIIQNALNKVGNKIDTLKFNHENVNNVVEQIGIAIVNDDNQFHKAQPLAAENQDAVRIVDDGDRNNGTLLAEGVNAGHTYPDIVKGLNVGRFGVYNCDQIYRLKNRVNIRANYKDENGKYIADGAVLSMIDLNYTGAFSFNPRSFTCDSKANNVLLLFTKSGRLYLLDKGEFEKLEIKKGENTFVMKEVTKSITCTKDLEKHLEL